ncbi:MAG: DUF2948 family protein [Hyphomicrobiaceae bacterium]|nr:DUF2948 family protein [Hyphomicrobiaceae bacterium]MCC0022883.1 DUF2948 family protein [Hyphomicrobiaceae bacterium]
MPDLKLLALDQEDLDVISAFTQDAVMRVEDVGYAQRDRRFALLMNRYCWEDGSQARKGVRKRTALRFDNVTGLNSKGINLNARDGVLELLTIRFDVTDDPEGKITLTFSGGGEIELVVECLEARLHDLGAAWAAQATPRHD